MTSDQKRWAAATKDELEEIAKKWAKKYSLRTLRAFQESYLVLLTKGEDSDYRAYDNRWQAATLAINIKCFTETTNG
jgi:hypothetical protein